MPPPGTGVLSFGLVAIPVRIHTATHSENVSFHLLHDKCGSRVRDQHYCPICNIVIERAALVRGFQHAKQYVPITEEELQASRPTHFPCGSNANRGHPPRRAGQRPPGAGGLRVEQPDLAVQPNATSSPWGWYATADTGAGGAAEIGEASRTTARERGSRFIR